MSRESQYAIRGEGSQVKQLIKDKFDIDDESAIQFIMGKMCVSREVVERHFEKKVISCNKFREMIAEVFSCEYCDLVKSAEDQIMDNVTSINNKLNCASWNDRKRSVIDLRMLQNENDKICYHDGKIMIEIVKARLLLELKKEGSWETIDAALADARETNSSLFVFGLCVKAYMYKSVNELKGALTMLERYEKLISSKEIIGAKYKTEFFIHLAISFKDRGDYDRAVKYIIKAEEFATRNFQLVRCLIYRGLLLKLSSNYGEALNTYEKALELSTEKSDKAMICNNMANIHNIRGDWNTGKTFSLKGIEYQAGINDISRSLSYYDTLLDALIKIDIDYNEFAKIYTNIKGVLINSWKGQKYRYNVVGKCIRKIILLATRFEQLEIINELYDITERIKVDSGVIDNVEFQLEDICAELVDLKKYYKVMNCEIIGEGAQLKKLLRKEFNVDDIHVIKKITEKISITEKTAINYLNRKLIPYETFRQFIRDVFNRDYYEVVHCPKEKITSALKSIDQNMECFVNSSGLIKINYFIKKAIELNYEYGEILGGIKKECVEFLLNDKKSFDDIDNLISRTRMTYIDLYISAILEKAHMLYNIGQYNESAELLYSQRKIIKEIEDQEELVGKYYYYLGLHYRKLDELKKAKKYADLSLKYITTPKIQVKRINNLGHILLEQKKYNQAIRCYKKIIDLTAYRPSYSKAYNNISNVHIQIKEFEKAYDFVLKAIAIIDAVNETSIKKQRFYYYDTLFEIILHSGIGHKKFVRAYETIASDVLYLNKDVKDIKVMGICVNRIADIIVKYNDKATGKRLLKCILDAIDTSEEVNVEKELKLIFAEVMLKLMKNSVIEDVV